MTYMKLAVMEAMKSDMTIKHGAVLVVNGKVMSRGYNHTRNYINGKLKYLGASRALGHYRENSILRGEPLCSLHSEMDCLLKMGGGRSYFLSKGPKEPTIS